jgi:hypothetical protein
MWAGAAGDGFVPWLACIPWLMAAILSLLLVATPRWLPRRLLVGAGWFATAVVAMIGPAACWSLVTALAAGRDLGLAGIANWVPCLFYGSWLLWAIAAAAATRAYQLYSTANQSGQQRRGCDFRRAVLECQPATAPKAPASSQNLFGEEDGPLSSH